MIEFSGTGLLNFVFHTRRFFMFTYISASPEQTGRLAERIGEMLPSGVVLCLNGDLGAGKTLFVQGLARGLGIQGDVTSPTFNLMNIYKGRLTVYHFDLYRLEQEEELEEIGFYDYTEEPDGAAVIEWADKFRSCLPEDYIEIEITRLEAEENTGNRQNTRLEQDTKPAETTEQQRRLTFRLHGTVHENTFKEMKGICQS